MAGPMFTRTVSPRRLRRLLNLFPPWLFQRIRVAEIDPDFRRSVVRVRRSRLTANLQGTTFGGTIYSAADPMFAILYWQVLAHRGVRVQGWSRSAAIRYLAPATTTLTLEFAISDEDIARAVKALERDGKYAYTHAVEAIDEAGRTCAVAEVEVFLRRPRDGRKAASAYSV